VCESTRTTRKQVPWWLCRFFSHDVKRAAVEASTLSAEERVACFGRLGLVKQFDSRPSRSTSRSSSAFYVDESYSFLPYESILPCTSDELRLAEDASDVPMSQDRLVAGFDVGRSRDRSELAVFEEVAGRLTCRMLKSFEGVPFAPSRRPTCVASFRCCTWHASASTAAASVRTWLRISPATSPGAAGEFHWRGQGALGHRFQKFSSSAGMSCCHETTNSSDSLTQLSAGASRREGQLRPSHSPASGSEHRSAGAAVRLGAGDWVTSTGKVLTRVAQRTA
jgi:hypothetical protein